jgi:hypothetical protein
VRRRPLCRPGAAALAAALCSALLAAPASAEEGVFTGRLAGGAALIHPEMPWPGGIIAASVDYGFKDWIGLTAGAPVTLHRDYNTLGLGAGVQFVPAAGERARLYLHLGPQLLLCWTRHSDEPVRPDLALHGGIGFHYLIVWGFGYVLELSGTLPAGLGPRDPLEAASLALHTGIFLEI